MINPFKLRKTAALMIPMFVSVMLFYMGLAFYGIFGAIIFLFLGVIIGVVVGFSLLKNPMQALLEGKGVLTMNVDSTGVIKPFISSLDSPYIRAYFNGKTIEDIFDREAVFNFAEPQRAGQGGFFDLKTKDKEGKDTSVRCWGLILTEEEFNRSRFGMFHYPALLWNDQTKTLMTKDFLSNLEKDVFSEHGILYLNEKTKELNSALRDFGRHVIETLKPRGDILGSTWFWIVVIIILIILGAMFLPGIMSAIEGTGQTAAGAAKAGGAFTPR